MDNTVIKTAVNVSLDQNDMVELMLEEQKEIRETEIQEISSRLGEYSAKYAAEKEALEEALIEGNSIRTSTQRQHFNQGVSTMKLKVIKEATVTYEHEEVGYFDYWNLSSYERYARPMTMFRSDLNKAKEEGAHRFNRCGYNVTLKKKAHTLDVPKSIALCLRAESEDGTIVLTSKGEAKNIKMNAEVKACLKKMRSIATDWFKDDERKHILEQELFALEYDNKRSKTKFIKGMLTNSETGQELVELIQNIRGENLVKIG